MALAGRVGNLAASFDSRFPTRRLPAAGVQIEGMQFLARLEANSFARCDADFGPGTGIAPDAGLARPYAENAKAAELNAVAFSQSLLKPFKYSVDSGFRFGPRQAGTLYDVMNDILFDQCRRPLIEEKCGR